VKDSLGEVRKFIEAALACAARPYSQQARSQQRLWLEIDQFRTFLEFQGSSLYMGIELSGGAEQVLLQHALEVGLASAQHFAAGLAQDPATGHLWLTRLCHDLRDGHWALAAVEELVNQAEVWWHVLDQVGGQARTARPSLGPPVVQTRRMNP
jgi:hypothetical protein